MGFVMSQLKGEAFRTGNTLLVITDIGSIFTVNFQGFICRLHENPDNIWLVEMFSYKS